MSDHPPVVTIVVPMLDEAAYIDDCLTSFAEQTYPKDRLEVLVVDGGSSDGSRDIVAGWAARHPWVRVVENPRRKAAAAFNVGVASSSGEVIGLFSAHGVADPDFVRRSVEALRASGAAGVGGQYVHEGRSPRATAIGLAMASPFGMASPHRFARDVREVDTISHPLYRRQALLEIGPFDESLARNSDYELNWRLRQAGHRLVLDPSIRSVYRPRESLRALARQFWWYGSWKAKVMRRHPASVRPRHLAPPVFVVLLLAAPMSARRPVARRLTGAAVLSYVAAAGVSAAGIRKQAANVDLGTLVLAYPVMHLAWGGGMVTSMAKDLFRHG